jgi:hypothetical protein
MGAALSIPAIAVELAQRWGEEAMNILVVTTLSLLALVAAVSSLFVVRSRREPSGGLSIPASFENKQQLVAIEARLAVLEKELVPAMTRGGRVPVGAQAERSKAAPVGLAVAAFPFARPPAPASAEAVRMAVLSPEPEREESPGGDGAAPKTIPAGVPDRLYHQEILPQAWRRFIEADGGANKGSVQKLEEFVQRAVGSDSPPVTTKHPCCQDLAVVRVQQPSGDVEVHGLPLADSYRNVMKFFDVDGAEASFSAIKDVVCTAEFDPQSMARSGEWVLRVKGVVRL